MRKERFFWKQACEKRSKISQLALMIDSFSLQHGMINDDETVGPAEG